MPVNPLPQVLVEDSLSIGRTKVNSNFEIVRLFINALESAQDGIVPEDVGDLIVAGKINPDYLDTYLASVTAADVSVADIGLNFTGTNVETVLAELYALIDAVEAVAGTIWYSDVGLPSNGLGIVGDYYVNTATSFVYKKTGASTWTFQFSMKGADGAGAGDVVGPASSLSGTIPVFSGLTGKLLSDSGVTVASLVPTTRTVSPGWSLSGGGSLANNITLSLLNDVQTPGPNMAYGTDGFGTKGWKPDGSSGGSMTTVELAVNTTISTAYNNTVIVCTAPLVLTLADDAQDNIQCSVLNVSNGAVTFVAGGLSTIVPTAPTLDNSSGAEISVASLHHHTAGAWYVITSAVGEIQSFTIMLSDLTTPLTIGAGKTMFRIPYSFYLTEVRAFVNTAPTGTDRLTVDINAAGSTILSTKLSFDAGEKTTTTSSIPAVISTPSLEDDAEIVFDIDTVGGTVAGAGLGVTLIGYRV